LKWNITLKMKIEPVLQKRGLIFNFSLRESFLRFTLKVLESNLLPLLNNRTSIYRWIKLSDIQSLKPSINCWLSQNFTFPFLSSVINPLLIAISQVIPRLHSSFIIADRTNDGQHTSLIVAGERETVKRGCRRARMRVSTEIASPSRSCRG